MLNMSAIQLAALFKLVFICLVLLFPGAYLVRDGARYLSKPDATRNEGTGCSAVVCLVIGLILLCCGLVLVYGCIDPLVLGK